MPDREAPAVVAFDVVFEPQAAPAIVQIAATAAKNSCRHMCLFEI
jgi:hypothetical protein